MKKDHLEHGTLPPDFPLPPDHVIHQLGTYERRVLYDYVVEV